MNKDHNFQWLFFFLARYAVEKDGRIIRLYFIISVWCKNQRNQTCRNISSYGESNQAPLGVNNLSALITVWNSFGRHWTKGVVQHGLPTSRLSFFMIFALQTKKMFQHTTYQHYFSDISVAVFNIPWWLWTRLIDRLHFLEWPFLDYKVNSVQHEEQDTESILSSNCNSIVALNSSRSLC